jgi:hypothetical protein
MTVRIQPICIYCQRFHGLPSGPAGITCDANPRGIPSAIFDLDVDHRYPHEGDGGRQFLARDAEAEEHALRVLEIVWLVPEGTSQRSRERMERGEPVFQRNPPTPSRIPGGPGYVPPPDRPGRPGAPPETPETAAGGGAAAGVAPVQTGSDNDPAAPPGTEPLTAEQARAAAFPAWCARLMWRVLEERHRPWEPDETEAARADHRYMWARIVQETDRACRQARTWEQLPGWVKGLGVDQLGLPEDPAELLPLVDAGQVPIDHGWLRRKLPCGTLNADRDPAPVASTQNVAAASDSTPAPDPAQRDGTQAEPPARPLPLVQADADEWNRNWLRRRHRPPTTAEQQAEEEGEADQD